MTSPYGPPGRNEPQTWGQQVPSQPTSYPAAYPNPYGAGLGESTPQPRESGDGSDSSPDFPADEDEPRGRTGLVWGIVVAAVVIIAGFVVLGYVWAPWEPAGRGFLVNTVFDSSAMDAGVAGILRTDYGYSDIQASDVSCPANQAVRQGSTFSCTASINGSTKLIPIKVTSDDGNYEVYRPQ
ncbi:MAG TPA: DUF4333 domain-containing protein [Pseudonocardiaceae bacterium]